MGAPDRSQEMLERSIVRFLLVKPALAAAVLDRVDPAAFENSYLRSMFGAAKSLYLSGREISVSAICDDLRRQGTNPSFVPELAVSLDEMDPFPESFSIAEENAALLNSAYNLRRFRDAARGIASFEDAVKLARQALDWDAAISNAMKTPAEIVEALIAKQEAIYSGSVVAGHSWGLATFDRYLQLETGKLYIAAGLKKSGKTHFLLHVIDHNLRADIPCLLFSIEMDVMSVYRRLLAKRTGIDSHLIFTRRLPRGDFERIREECEEIARGPFPLYVDDSPALSVLDVAARARRWKYSEGVQDGVGIVGVDFLQILKMSRQRGDSEATAIKATAFELARTAKDLNVAILAVAQLNNLAEREEPHIRHLEGSGAIAQASEAVVLIDLPRRREDSYKGEGQKAGPVEDVFLIIAEQRSGESGIKIPAKVDFRTSTFFDVDPRYEQTGLGV